MKIRVAGVLAVAAAVVFGSGLAACSGSGTTSAPSATAGSSTIPLIRVGLAGSISSLDQAHHIGAGPIDSLSLDTLVKFGPQGQIEPELATSWAQTSPVTYVYHLRHDVKFWDGHPLTADDVAYSLNHNRGPGSQVAFGFTSVKSIVATDPYTVTVTLTGPDATWKLVPAENTSYIFEKAFQQAHPSTFGAPGTLVMGSGPWMIDSLDPTKGAELSANPHWWGGKVPVQHVSYTFYNSENDEALAFRASEIDVTWSLTNPKGFANTSGAKLLTTQGCGNAWFGMNTSQPGWDDVHVRRAVAYALNRTDIIAAYGGYATPIYTFTPPQLLTSIASQSQINALLASLPLYQYNLAAAKQEMAESRYPHGFSATTLAYSDPSYLNVNQVIATELAKIGIKLSIKPMPGIPWDNVESGPAAKRSTVFSGGGCFQPDPATFGDFLGSANLADGSWNIANYAPPTVDTMLAEGKAATNPAQRFAVYAKLWAQMQADEPYVGLFVTDTAVALSAKFTWPGYNAWYWEGHYLLDIKPT